MAGFRIKFDLGAVLRGFRGMISATKTRGAINRQIRDLVADSIQKNFDVGGRPRRWKRRKKPARHKILDKSSRLRRSVDVRVTRRWIIARSPLPYAAVHQFGFQNIPARPFLVVLKKDERAIATLIEKQLTRPLR